MTVCLHFSSQTELFACTVAFANNKKVKCLNTRMPEPSLVEIDNM